MADDWFEGVGEGASSWPTLDFAVTGDTQPAIQMVDGRNRAQKTETRRRFAVFHELFGGRRDAEGTRRKPQITLDRGSSAL